MRLLAAEDRASSKGVSTNFNTAQDHEIIARYLALNWEIRRIDEEEIACIAGEMHKSKHATAQAEFVQSSNPNSERLRIADADIA